MGIHSAAYRRRNLHASLILKAQQFVHRVIDKIQTLNPFLPIAILGKICKHTVTDFSLDSRPTPTCPFVICTRLGGHPEDFCSNNWGDLESGSLTALPHSLTEHFVVTLQRTTLFIYLASFSNTREIVTHSRTLSLIPQYRKRVGIGKGVPTEPTGESHVYLVGLGADRGAESAVGHKVLTVVPQ